MSISSASISPTAVDRLRGVFNRLGIRRSTRMTIRLRLFTGFGVVVGLSLALALFGLWQLTKLDVQVSGLSRVSTNAVSTLESAQALESMNRLALRYKMYGDKDALQAFDAAYDLVKDRIGRAFQSAVRKDRKDQYGAMLQGVEPYRENFQRFVALADKLRDAKGKLGASGDTMVEATTQLVDAAKATGNASLAAWARDVQSAMLLVGSTTWRYIAAPEPKGLAAFSAASGAAKGLLDDLDSKAPDNIQHIASDLGDALMANVEHLEAAVESMNQIDDLFERSMQPQAQELLQKEDSIKTEGLAGLARTTAETGDLIATTAWLQKIIIALAAVIGAAMAWLIGRAIARPIVAMTGAMRKLAGGDRSVEVPAQTRKDEIGEMAAAVQVFKQNLIDGDRLRAEQESMKAQAQADKKAALNGMADDFEANVKEIVETVSAASNELKATARTMADTADQTSQRSTAVAAASEQASANVQTVATAAEQLSASINEISRQVAESAQISGQAVIDARQTNSDIQALSDSAQKIGEVVKLINDIADQTNLLALNATIEAARAGEAGKGFAVVASEVKSLATQTAKATEDIAAQVEAIQGATGGTVRAIQAIGQTIGRMNEIATTIAAAVEEQGAATKEIARNVQQASAGTSDVSANIGAVTQAAGETGAAASQVLDASDELARQAENLRGRIDGFIAQIRAA